MIHQYSISSFFYFLMKQFVFWPSLNLLVDNRFPHFVPQVLPASMRMMVIGETFFLTLKKGMFGYYKKKPNKNQVFYQTLPNAPA